jgi:hypothetical protein
MTACKEESKTFDANQISEWLQEQLHPQELQFVPKVAEILIHAMQLEYAASYYLISWGSQPSGSRKVHYLLAYAMGVQPDVHGLAVRNILNQTLDGLQNQNLRSYERILVQMALVLNYSVVGGDPNEYFEHIEKARKLIHNNIHTFLRRLQEPMNEEGIRLDLSGYTFLNVSLHILNNPEKDIHTIPLKQFFEKNLLEAFLLQKPGPFELNNDKMENVCIRECLVWCQQVLANLSLQNNVRFDLLRAPGLGKDRKRHLALYSFLLQNWYENEHNSRIPSSWNEENQAKFGMIPEELTAVLASLILEHSVRGYQFNLAYSSKDERLIERCVASINLLLANSDRGLAEDFLKHYADPHRWIYTLCDPVSAADAAEKLLQAIHLTDVVQISANTPGLASTLSNSTLSRMYRQFKHPKTMWRFGRRITSMDDSSGEIVLE